MIGQNYWATGITLQFVNQKTGWSAEATFQDNGLCDDDIATGRISTVGRLETRHLVPAGDDPAAAATAAALAVKNDAERMGVIFGDEHKPPQVYLHRDNWRAPNVEVGTPEIEDALRHVSAALGWPDGYSRRAGLEGQQQAASAPPNPTAPDEEDHA